MNQTNTEFQFKDRIQKGRPKIYSDAALLVFFAMMTLKQINATRAQHRWLQTHPIMLETLRLRGCPSRLTLRRRYKALAGLLIEFSEFIAEWTVSKLNGQFQTDMFFACCRLRR